MKNKLLFILIVLSLTMAKCSKKTLYEIPTVDGAVIITGISSSTSNGVSALDPHFTVDVTFATAKAGDEMNVELLKSQIPSGGISAQWLPMAGTQKKVKVGNDLKSSVTYTRDEAKMANVGDAVKVVFSGKTAYSITLLSLQSALTVSDPAVLGNKVQITRTAENAFITVAVSPKAGPYSGNVVVKRKNGQNGSWVDVGSFTSPSLVPISGNDFAIGQDTMIYTFTATSGAYTDNITRTLTVTNPYFFLKKSGVLTLGGALGGLDILTNTAFPSNDVRAAIAINGGSILLHGGSAWIANGNSIMFVPSTMELYAKNSVNEVMTAFAAGPSSPTANPTNGAGVYIFKMVNGPDSKDVFYGMIKTVSIVPGVSVTYEYRIGNLYAHLAVIR